MFFPHLGGIVFHHFLACRALVSLKARRRRVESDEKKDNPINPVDPVQILFIS
jgi:hypothetical protein